MWVIKWLIIIVGVFAVPAHAGFIDCNTASLTTPIQDAINNGDTDIEFVGTCTENLFYGGPGPLRLRGQGPVISILEGGVSVRNSYVRMENFKVQGVAGAPFSSDAVFLSDGANGRLESMTMDLPRALMVFSGSTAIVNESVINHVQSVKDCPLICVGDNSQFRIANSEVNAEINDPAVGPVVSALRDSSIVFRGGNIIENAGSTGTVGAFQSSSIRVDDPSGNGPDIFKGGFRIRSMAFVDLRQGTVNGPIMVTRHSLLDIGNDLFGGVPESIEVNGNVQISKDSAIEVLNSLITVNGDVVCEDLESSLNTDDFRGEHTIDCNDYNNSPIRKGLPSAPGNGNGGQGNSPVFN